MALVLNDDQQMLKEAASGFINQNAPVSKLRELRDSEAEEACSPDLWIEMAEMGWSGVLVPEDEGGAGFGMVGAGIIAEEMGRQLVASPYVATAVMGATALNIAGSKEQRGEIFPALLAGELLMGLAVDEGSRHRPFNVTTKAERSGNGFKLSGRKTFVADGHIADRLIVAARTSGAVGDSGGITMFLVDAGTKGISRERAPMVDSRGYADIEFTDVELTADAVLGDVDGGGDVLTAVLNAGRACIAAEMVGSAAQAFEMTLSYIAERKQFGVPLGSFQALQHRAAHLYTEIEMCRAMTLSALQALDNNADDAGVTVAIAKAKVGQVALLAAQEGVQFHGGMGMTDEFDIGLYLKRMKVAGEFLGDASYHGEQVALALGY